MISLVIESENVQSGVPNTAYIEVFNQNEVETWVTLVSAGQSEAVVISPDLTGFRFRLSGGSQVLFQVTATVTGEVDDQITFEVSALEDGVGSPVTDTEFGDGIFYVVA